MNIISKLKVAKSVFQNMGWSYVRYRLGYEFARKSGLLKRKFPSKISPEKWIDLNQWRKESHNFFFVDKESLKFEKTPNEKLKKEYENFRNGKMLFFNALELELGNSYDWITNPSNGYKYSSTQHWTELENLSSEAGDIKFVWEKSRFSYLLTLIRYDYHFSKDCSDLVFSEIEDWIANNPINCGPNYICSQEISLRILNWTFALQYFKNSPALTEERFNKIIDCIYWQVKHVRANINFSRKAVRNNHAISETLLLYVSGFLFPFFPESKTWGEEGRKWFEAEIKHQIFTDGTYLQYSHNYHRVVIQLMTWAFVLTEKNNKSFSAEVYNRANKSLNYLYQCQSGSQGELPNYGPNDGALFFKLNNQDYRDYRPTLNALACFLHGKALFEGAEFEEDISWLQIDRKQNFSANPPQKASNSEFKESGVYLHSDRESFTFIRCGNHRDRPSQADNLHLDIWYNGENVLRDAGSYKYNTSPELKRYFNGTSAHNTVSIGEYDQMEKGPRFIWLNWSQSKKAHTILNDEFWLFEGEILAFEHLGKGIKHQRKVKKYINKNCWEIEDELNNPTEAPLRQWWNFSSIWEQRLEIVAFDEAGDRIQPIKKEGFFAPYYGVKEKSVANMFETTGKIIRTTIKIL